MGEIAWTHRSIDRLFSVMALAAPFGTITAPKSSSQQCPHRGARRSVIPVPNLDLPIRDNFNVDIRFYVALALSVPG